MIDPPTVVIAVLLVALVTLLWRMERLQTNSRESLQIATTVIQQRDQLSAELRRAAVATVALADLVGMHYPWDEATRERVQLALIRWLSNPADADARGALEDAALPIAWLDGAAPILARPEQPQAETEEVTA